MRNNTYADFLSMNYETSEALRPFLEKVYRRSRSSETVDTYRNGVMAFCKFCGKEPSRIIQDIREERVEEYSLLDEYVTYLSKANKSPNTISTYFAAAKKFLRFHGVEIHMMNMEDQSTQRQITISCLFFKH
jgi:site-specific recombinase XerD